MRLLFIHQNFPGQFLHLANYYSTKSGFESVGLKQGGEPQTIGALRVLPWTPAFSSTKNLHSAVSDYEAKVSRGIGVAEKCRELRAEGFVPDKIIAHSGWGEVLFIREIYPDAELIIYNEFYYQTHGTDFNFDPEFQVEPREAYHTLAKNPALSRGLIDADVVVTPTPFQASRIPQDFQHKVRLIHEGVDTKTIGPDPDVTIDSGRVSRPLTRKDKIITFVNRNFEPTRGYHSFMRALPKIMREDEDVRIFMPGEDGTSYGAKPKDGISYKQRFLDEVKDQIDMERIHFVGKLEREVFTNILQISTVHVYLTAPFVLSWSLLEAMACGACVVGSDTPPVRDAIVDGDTGFLVDFFDYEAIADRVLDCLNAPEERGRVGENARSFVVSNYDRDSICMPKWQDLIESNEKN